MEQRFFLYDGAPPSSTNPVIASARACGIEITQRECNAFLRGDDAENRRTLSTKEKHRQLDRLIDQHLLLRQAYRDGLDRTPKVAEMIAYTRAHFLQDALLQTVVGPQAKSEEDFQRIKDDLLGAIYRRHPVEIDAAALPILIAAARAIDAAAWRAVAAGDLRLEGEMYSKNCDDIIHRLGAGVLAHAGSEDEPLADFLVCYGETELVGRPDVSRCDTVVRLVKKRLADRMLVLAAHDRGLDRTEAFQETLQLNRNTLVQAELLERTAEEVGSAIAAPGAEQAMQRWFEENRAVLPKNHDAGGEACALSWPENREEISALYREHLRDECLAEKARQLRTDCKIVVQDDALMLLFN